MFFPSKSLPIDLRFREDGTQQFLSLLQKDRTMYVGEVNQKVLVSSVESSPVKPGRRLISILFCVFNVEIGMEAPLIREKGKYEDRNAQ